MFAVHYDRWHRWLLGMVYGGTANHCCIVNSQGSNEDMMMVLCDQMECWKVQVV
jgi:hypothetical protein